MTDVPLKHLVFLPGISWGHVRPGMKTSLRMVEKFENLFISVFVTESELSKTTKYLDAQPSTSSSRIRIVVASSSGESMPVVSFLTLSDIFSRLEKLFELWITNELQRTTDVRINGRLVDTPICIIEDQQTGGISLACKHIHKLPVVSWWSTTAASLISRHGNEKNGHGARIFDTVAQRQGISSNKAPEIYLQSPTDWFAYQAFRSTTNGN
ncbi:unnamed protein product, partial [Rhizoctonia solani]